MCPAVLPLVRQCTAVMNGLLFTYVQAMVAGNLTCSQLVSSYVQVGYPSTQIICEFRSKPSTSVPACGVSSLPHFLDHLIGW